MKKLSLYLLAFAMINSSFAADSLPQLRLKIAGVMQKNEYFLCLYGEGCFNMHTAENNKSFPIESDVLNNLYKVAVADMNAHTLYAQPIPSSCQVVPQNNQTVTVLGKLSIQHEKPYIKNLRCTIS